MSKSLHNNDSTSEATFAEQWYRNTKLSRAQLLSMSALPFFLAVVTLIGIIAVMAVFSKKVPDEVVTIFGTTMKKGGYFVLAFISVLMINVFALFPTYVFRHMWCWSCVSNKHYWTALPEREKSTMVYLVKVTSWFVVDFNALLLVVLTVNLSANTRANPEPDSKDIAIYCVALVFFLTTTFLLFHHLHKRFTSHTYQAIPKRRPKYEHRGSDIV